MKYLGVRAMIEIRTTRHIVADLLQHVVDSEWSGTIWNRDQEFACCPKCDVIEDYNINFPTFREHEEHCEWKKIVVEARAFLEAENKLAEKNGEETIYIP